MAFTARTETYAQGSSLASPYSFTINKAGGTVDGDIMFMFLATFLAGTPPTIDSVPAGWTLVATNTTTYSRWYLYYKIASGEGANYTWSLTASCRYYALNIAYSSGDFDVQSIGDITAISNTLYPTAGATVRAASMSVPAANSPLVYFGAIYNTTVRTFTKPSVPTTDWVEDADEGNTTPDLSLTIGSMIWSGSGNTGNMDITCSTSITTYKHAFAVALKPAPPSVVVPTLITIGAPDVTESQALGFGSIEATGGENCDQRGFDYGFDTGYGSEALDSGSFGVGTYEKLITGLLPDTTYHFRAKAHNSAGWGYGADDTFTTSAAGSTETLRPNAAGDVSNLLDYPTAGDDWDKVDEAVADEATTYIYTSGGGVSLFNLPAHSGSGTINFIKVYARCAWGENGDSCRIAIKTGGTEYYSGPINESADWVTYNYQWNTNPKTSAAWTWDDIDALQIGIELSGQGVENNNCTQVYVEVDYTEVPAEQELTASAVAVASSAVNGAISGSGNAPLTGVPVSVSSSVQPANIAGSGNAPLTASPVAVASSVVNAEIQTVMLLSASPIAVTSSVVTSSISTSYLQGWAGQRRKITIDQTNISGEVNFPVYVKISTSSGISHKDVSSIFDELGDNYLKIAVTGPDGFTQCKVEVVSWSAATEYAELHVNIPDPTSYIWLYYDNTHADNSSYVGVTGSVPGKAVWDANYVAVYHMNDVTASTIADSTGVNNGTKKGAGEPLEVAGLVGKAQDFDGSDDIVTLVTANVNFGSYYSIEALIQSDLLTGEQYIIGTQNMSEAGDFYFRKNNATNILQFGEYVAYRQGATALLVSTRYYGCATKNGGTVIRLYLNGALDNGAGHTDSNEGINWDEIVTIGKGYRNLIWNGLECEIRISNIARSATWIASTNQSLADALLTFGDDCILNANSVSVSASVPTASISGSGNAPLTPSPVTVASSVQPASISGSGSAPLVSVSVAVNATVNTAGISGSGSAPLILSPLAVVASIVASAISGSGSAPLVALSLAVESSVVRPAIGYGNQYLTHTAIAIETSVVTPTIALVAFILATAYLHSREAEAYLYDREKTAYLYDRDYVARGRTG